MKSKDQKRIEAARRAINAAWDYPSNDRIDEAARALDNAERAMCFDRRCDVEWLRVLSEWADDLKELHTMLDTTTRHFREGYAPEYDAYAAAVSTFRDKHIR